MPNVHRVFFDAPANGELELTVTFEAQVTTGNDWSTTDNYVVVTPYIVTSGDIVSVGPDAPLSTTRLAYTVQHVFPVVIGPVEAGWDAFLFGISAVTFWNVRVRATLVKR